MFESLLPILASRAPQLMRQYLPPGPADTWSDTWTRRAVASCLEGNPSPPPPNGTNGANPSETPSGSAGAATPIPEPIKSVLTGCLRQASDQQVEALVGQLVDLALSLDLARKRDARAREGLADWPAEPLELAAIQRDEVG